MLTLILILITILTLVFSSFAANYLLIREWWLDRQAEKDRLRRDKAYHALLTPKRTNRSCA